MSGVLFGWATILSGALFEWDTIWMVHLAEGRRVEKVRLLNFENAC